MSNLSNCPKNTAEIGKANECKGCPSQIECSNQTTEAEIYSNYIVKNYKKIKIVIFIISGKGGVGKSTISVLLAREFSNKKIHVGILDLDFSGPSIPIATGVIDSKFLLDDFEIEPIEINDYMMVLSVGNIESYSNYNLKLSLEKEEIFKIMIKNSNWKETEILIIDTPPGTTDEHIMISKYFQKMKKVVILVGSPQISTVTDLKKSINFCQRTSIPIIGIVETMKEYICPKCMSVSKPLIGVYKDLKELNYPILASFPFTKVISKSIDLGISIEEIQLEDNQETKFKILKILNQLITKVIKILNDDYEIVFNN